MKLVQINTVCNGSTGRIMGDIQRVANSEGFETLSIYGRRKGYKDLRCKKVGGFFSFWFHVFLTTVFDMHGHGSYFKTKKIVKILKKENPDIIHLHNIHGYYLNYKVLFKYLRNEYKGKIFWTLHDCIPFTGHCSHFILANCDRWKKVCHDCPNKKKYPTSLFIDRSYKNYIEKEKLFTGLNNLTIITPSDWLNRLVRESFLKEYYNVITINNGIDLNIFKPTEDETIYKKYKIPKDKRILLGVANVWTKEKGLDEFIALSKQLVRDDYVVVLVGLKRKQIKKLKEYKNIIKIKRTENQLELVKLYTSSYVYINFSREETFSLTTLESLACDTPVIVYENTPMVEFVLRDNVIRDFDEVLKKIKMFDLKPMIIDDRYSSTYMANKIIENYKVKI